MFLEVDVHLEGEEEHTPLLISSEAIRSAGWLMNLIY